MEKFESIIRSLNTSENIPKFAFRRNSRVYELVSTVNNMVACYIAGNYKPLDTFSQRASDFMKDNPDLEGSAEYYNIVREFLSQLSNESS